MLQVDLREQYAHYQNKIDCRDIRVANLRNKSDLISYDSSLILINGYIRNIQNQFEAWINKDVGFVLELIVSGSNIAEVLLINVNGASYTVTTFATGGGRVPVYSTDLILHANNLAYDTRHLGFSFTYIPRSRFTPEKYDKLLSQPRSGDMGEKRKIDSENTQSG